MGRNRSITITGSGFNFLQHPDVTFRFLDTRGSKVSMPALKPVVKSDTEIEAEIPDFRQAIAMRRSLGGAGSLDLKIYLVVGGTVNQGRDRVDSPVSGADQYTVLGPAVTSVHPRQVTYRGGQGVDLHGQGFDGATKVSFLQVGTGKPISTIANQASAPATVKSHDALTFTTPDVKSIVNSAGGKLTVNVVVEIPSPTITSRADRIG